MTGMRGFTLVELVITIAIGAILLAMAIPGMRSFVLKASRGDASTSLYTALVQARAEAITRNATVTVCQRDFTNTNAFPRCSTSSNAWTGGWIVYRDSNPTDTGAKPYAAADILSVADRTDTAFTITTNPSAVGSVQFDASGRNSSGTRLNLYLCKSADASFEGRSILVEPNGRVTLAPYTSCSAT